MVLPGDIDEDEPIFAIAMAAELAGMHPQTLRQYDRIGLVVPQRTAGRVRRYSLRDVAALREIAQLSADGVSLEGIARIIELRDEVRALRKRVQRLESELANERLRQQGARVFAAGQAGDVIPLARGRRVSRRTEVVLWCGGRYASQQADAELDYEELDDDVEEFDGPVYDAASDYELGDDAVRDDEFDPRERGPEHGGANGNGRRR